MKTKILPIISLALAISSPLGHAEGAKAAEPLYPVRLFMGTCVAGHGEPAEVARLAKALGIEPAADKVARRYLGGNTGDAWYVNNDQGEFGIAVMDRKALCSVFVHGGDAAAVQASLEAGLPGEGSGLSFTRELVDDSGVLATTAYRIFRGDTMLEQWVITVSSHGGTKLAAILSYNKP